MGPRYLSDKKLEGPTGCHSFSMLNYRKTQSRSHKTVILNPFTVNIILNGTLSSSLLQYKYSDVPE